MNKEKSQNKILEIIEAQKLFDLPKIKVPNSFELFEPEYNEKITTDIKGMNGNVKNVTSHTSIHST